MLRGLSDDHAREMSKLLRTQAYADRRFRETTATLRLDDLEHLHAVHSGTVAGARGGKRKRLMVGCDVEGDHAPTILAAARSRYEVYLLSEHWREVKRRYRASDLPQDCYACGAAQVDLHHVTYVRLGHEELTDLVPLCRDHHDRVHSGELRLDTLCSPS